MKFRSLSLVLVLLMVIGLMACNDTSFDDAMNVIEAEEVGQVYLDGSVIVVDARGEEAYNTLHLKDAICIDPSELLVDKPVPATVAPKAKVQRVLSKKGITNDSTVYIYDDNGGVNAFRIWWTMKLYGHEDVKVVNGGFEALGNLGLTASTSETVLEPAEYVAKDADESLIIDFEALEAITQDENTNVKIIDVRSPAEYDAGNILGSILYPHSNNLYSDGTFMSARDMYLFYKDKGFEKDDEIVLYCKSSFRATQTMALLEEAGFTNMKIYDGAWLEWEANGGEAATTDDAAPVTGQDGS
ncbi:sulfurtransferase [Acidaminobacter sp. JC074]|uniref:sulfurtransferase n=1 Tax=Acidaminobacter sp. JC074 TaxID=2530199 RepID=UPI001F112F9A|nr:rhodanese-like domain-containing protein [Acidaminobacter sp. JC074]MCH4888444.1 sulfurtransferase [Acidaminobacter sp. JC074]